MRTGFLITGLLLLIISALMMSYMTVPYGSSEGFMNFAATAAGVSADPMGAFDGIKLTASNESQWRATAPNEALKGPAFVPGNDNLFMFKNNQCKPECCGASFSCGGGCVCTTPDQRKYINERGGNRTSPDDGV